MDGAPLLRPRQSLLPSDHRGTASQAIKALEASGYLVRQRSKAHSKLPGDCALSKRGGRGNLEVSGTFAAEIARQSLYPAIGARPDGGGAGARPIRHRPSCAAALYDDLRRRAPARAAGARAGAGTAIRRARRADRRTSRSRARLSSLASVGNITAFGCTVVPAFLPLIHGVFRATGAVLGLGAHDLEFAHGVAGLAPSGDGIKDDFYGGRSHLSEVHIASRLSFNSIRLGLEVIFFACNSPISFSISAIDIAPTFRTSGATSASVSVEDAST